MAHKWLVQVVKEVIDPKAKITFKENTADDPHMRKPDISKAKEFLGWAPKIALKDGLPLMVEDFRKRVFQDAGAKEVIKQEA
jgi:UDP-glucuronate decarboxylase